MPDYLAEAKELFNYTRDLRRDFHANPELGFEEVRTAGIVAAELNQLGLEVAIGVAQTGVVALIEGSRPGPVVLCRFDMDALPIVEENTLDYVSMNPGVMHACGHDGHTAMGLTVAKLLHAHREEFAGTVKLVFQPAEEGLGGAEGMVIDGVLKDPRPDYSLAMHLWNNLPLGKIGISPGPVMAGSEMFTIRIIGKGGHGAQPHTTKDPVLAAAQIITALQSVVARNVDPLNSAVVSVTAFHGGDVFNIIPEEVELRGTIRSYLPEIRTLLINRVDQIVHGIAESMGCEAEAQIVNYTPAVINDPDVTANVMETAGALFDEETLVAERTMSSEDFAYMMLDIPGCFFFIGSQNSEKGLDYNHHNPRFNFDEDALPRGVALMAAAVADLLKGDLITSTTLKSII